MSPQPTELDASFPPEAQARYVALLAGRVGLTRRRAECFVRLWGYLWLKQATASGTTQAIETLDLPTAGVSCTCREAAELFYADSERGSDRAAGLMLDKLAALGLIQKTFNGNTLEIAIAPLAELEDRSAEATVEFDLDTFDPRCDAIPVATMLAANYNWLNRNAAAMPHRIARLLRAWAEQYAVGMRVLRRQDNLNPIAFYLLYPTAPESEAQFFCPPTKGIHLGKLADDDPFLMASPGDRDCRALFVRSWAIEAQYRDRVQPLLLRDTQSTIQRLLQDFPNLCDLYTLTIHPMYEEITRSLGFQAIGTDPQSSIAWMYLAVDRFMGIQHFE